MEKDATEKGECSGNVFVPSHMLCLNSSFIFGEEKYDYVLANHYSDNSLVYSQNDIMTLSARKGDNNGFVSNCRR